MESHDVPGTEFSFATLYLFVMAINVAVMVLRYVISKRSEVDGGSTPSNKRKIGF